MGLKSILNPFSKSKPAPAAPSPDEAKRLALAESLVERAHKGELLAIGEGKNRLGIGYFKKDAPLPNQEPGDVRQDGVLSPGLFVQCEGVVSYGDYQEERIHWFFKGSDHRAVKALANQSLESLQLLAGETPEMAHPESTSSPGLG